MSIRMRLPFLANSVHAQVLAAPAAVVHCNVAMVSGDRDTWCADGCLCWHVPAGHFFNGFTWRLKLTVKPPDPGSANEMNIHVGLCWGIEVEGDGPLPLSENTMVQVCWACTTCA